jgi:hypothetical protein
VALAKRKREEKDEESGDPFEEGMENRGSSEKEAKHTIFVDNEVPSPSFLPTYLELIDFVFLFSLSFFSES